MKVNTVNAFNNAIDHINSLGAIIERENPEISIPFSAADISFRIILGYLEDIVRRSVELNDPVLLEACRGLHIIPEAALENIDQSREAKSHGNPTSPA